MNWKVLLRSKKSLTPREAASKRRLYVFVLCLLGSAVFWLFIKLSQENQASYHKNILFQNFPEGMTGINQSDSVVNFTLEPSGIRLITESYFSPVDTFFVDVNQLQRLRQNERDVYYISREDLHNELNAAYGDWANVTMVSPDTVKIEAVPAITKKLPVELHADITFERRFNLYGQKTVQPDSLLVTGPKTILDTIQSIRTEYLRLENIRSTVRKDLAVDIPSALLSSGVSNVTLHIPVEEFTEAAITLPLVIKCPDPQLREQIRLFPSSVNLSYVVAVRDYRMVNENMFEVSVTCPQIDLYSTDRLRIQLDKHPAFVEVLNIRPSSVDYVIME